MARTPARRGERKWIEVGSVWTDGHTDVEVTNVQVYAEYRYVVYRIRGTRTTLGPIDDHTFSLRYTAKCVRKDEVRTLATEIKSDPDAGKVRVVGWAG